jgi:hypothetical protein
MNWHRWDFAYLARALGGLIIVGGTGLAAWSAIDFPKGYPLDGDPTRYFLGIDGARYFLGATLTYAFWGFIVILLAELALQMDRTGSHPIDEGQALESDASEHVGAPPLVRMETIWAFWNNVNFIQVGRAAGVLIIIGGIALAGWDALDRQPVLINLTTRDAAKFILGNVLQYTFYGLVVILLAELAQRVGSGWITRAEDADHAVRSRD